MDHKEDHGGRDSAPFRNAPNPVDQEEERRRKLYFALRTRVLSDEEMEQVERYGHHICIELRKSYFETDKIQEFNAALLQQYKIRSLEAIKPNSSPSPSQTVPTSQTKE